MNFSSRSFHSLLVSLSPCFLVLVTAPLAARTIEVVDEECEHVAVISAAAPRLSWACEEYPLRGVFMTHWGFHLSPGRAFLICFPLDKIPKGQRIRSAELTLPVWDVENGAGRITVRRILGSWGAGVCHQYRMVRPKPVEWTKPGARAVGSDCATKPTAVVRIIEKGRKLVNVTKDVEMWYHGDAANHGWIITADDPGTNLNLMSPISDYPAGRGVWKLTIEYVPE